jgi:acyl phosphate:glycerol-3-phosphate acyltransferase
MGLLSLPLLAAFGLGYLFGSIPFGLILTRAAGLGDIRKVGSGNIGATNVLRTGNKGLAAVTLLLDALKGTAAVVAATYLGLQFVMRHLAETFVTQGGSSAVVAPDAWLPFAAAGGLGAFIGHLYPVWLGFKGGKGVATYIGVLFGLAPPAGAAFCLVWLLVAAVTKYSSLSALVASAVTPVAVWFMGAPKLAILLVPMTALLIYKHAPNISRLLKGEEPKIGAKF